MSTERPKGRKSPFKHTAAGSSDQAVPGLDRKALDAMLTQQATALEDQLAKVRRDMAAVLDYAQQVDARTRAISQELDDVVRTATSLEGELARLEAENQQLREDLTQATSRASGAI